jgi:hypothetical protein
MQSVQSCDNLATMLTEVVVAIATAFSAITALIAVIVAWKVWRGQESLTKSLAARQEQLANELSERERLLTQRQLLLPLWQYISTLSQIDPKNPVVPDVLRVVNTLELVALCCEGEIIDPRVVKRTFRDTYIMLYQQVEQCGVLPGLGKLGRSLMNENRAAIAFYQELMNEHMQRDSLKGQ